VSLTHSTGTNEPTTDPVIRCALKARISARSVDSPGTVLIEELGLCRHEVRVDIAVVNGQLHGYEIKSDRDTLRRLSQQARIYCRVLDRVTLVTGSRHMAEALQLVPEWWGVLTTASFRGMLVLKTCRRGSPNPSRSARSVSELLWRDEALALIESRGGARGFRGKPRSVLWNRVCELYSLNEIAAAARECLKARPNSRSVQSCA
jgi:hypothetical protein